jgi:MFS transporter, MHS family, proline/betaine transporter
MKELPEQEHGGTRSGVGKEIFAALSIGTVVEWFDFALYGFSSEVISKAFFPSGHSGAALLGTFAIYSVSFVIRPVGGVVFGRIGDRVGRKAALSVSLVMMGLSTAAIGLIPSYASIGLLAPLLLVLARLAQGFSASTELPGASMFMAESAPHGRRAYGVNLIGSFGSFGTASATLVILLFRIDPEAYDSGGWRWPFVIGGIVAVAGMYLRRRMHESAVFQEVKADAELPVVPFGEMVRRHYRAILVLVVVYALGGIGFQTLMGYLPTYMTTVGGLSSTPALLISLVAFTAYGCLVIAYGRLSDRVGRKPVLLAGTAAVALLTIPAYLMIRTGELPLLCAAQALLVLPMAAVQASGYTAVLEIFPTSVRYSAVALAYTVSYAAFASTAPLIDALLTSAWGDLMPAVYGVTVAVLTFPVLFKALPESARYSIRTGRPETVVEQVEPV